ncbi:EmrA/EmrK family multidrug efflux transporter periplasmic adaptor subunit [Thorsellia kenyensis]|uniref:EmrA/EmrK family multidrug efflux transporter periplasmic adaptor subunit n=1 Tax=Thorsellia kenyensis TaxID=1549888 RepID=A0ABV6CCW9_9GAMM
MENKDNTPNEVKKETIHRSDDNSSNSTQRNSKKRKFALSLLFLITAGGISIYSGHWFLSGRFHIETDNAYVAGNQVQIMPEITGMVNTIHAENTDYVQAGDLLVTLDSTDAEQRFEKAKSILATSVRQINQSQFQIKQYEAIVLEKETELAQAKRDLSRRSQLIQSNAIGKEELQHAQDAVKLAQAAFEASKQNLLANKVLIQDTPIESQPSVVKAASELKEAWIELERTKITSPVSGYVSRRSVQVGSQVVPSIPLMVIVPSDNFWIEANFKETQLSKMRIGQKAEVTTDLYGKDVKFSGVVKGIDMGTGSAFSLLPAQNATGNWIKIVQRVPVRIELDNKELANYPLRIGLSTNVNVNIKDSSGAHLAESKGKTHYEADSASFDMLEIESLINQIIKENTSDFKLTL